MSGKSLTHGSIALGAPLLFGLAILASPDFSHPVHLELGLACAHCHAGAETSRQAGDQIFPRPAVCLSCHSDAGSTPLDAARLRWTAPERTYRFDHAFHVRLGDLAPFLAAAIDDGKYLGSPEIRPLLERAGDCTACHRGLELRRGPRPCPSCRTAWSATRRSTTPSVAATATWRGVNLRPADHTQEFADLHGTGKIQLDKASCAALPTELISSAEVAIETHTAQRTRRDR